MAYLKDLFFRAASRSLSYRIHSNENIRSREILCQKPSLKGSARNCLSGKDALRSLRPDAIPDEDGRVVTRLVQGVHV